MEDYAAFSALDGLPPLVRRQRTLEAKIVPLEPLVEEEKTLRKEIDALLELAGVLSGDGVLCVGYDVVRHERKGNASLNPDKIVEKLKAEGVDEGLVLRVLIESTERGDPSHWASVKPSKGAKVRTVPAEKHRAAKAALRRRAS